MTQAPAAGCRVVFTPSGLEGVVDAGASVLDAARRLGVDLDSVCGGRGICGRCQVTPSIGSFAKWAIDATPDAIAPVGPAERDARPARRVADGNRLGCLATIVADAVIDVPAASQVHRQVVCKDLDLDAVDVDPRFRLQFADDRTTASVVAGSSGQSVGVDDADADGGAGRVVATWPGFVDTAYGIAIDIGSTTVAGHCCDLFSGEILASAGRMNPQIRFGEDLMSRVSYVMMNPGGDADLTGAIRGALDELVGELVAAAGTSRDRVLELVLVGNPIMHHLVLGFDAVPLGQAPFPLHTADAVVATAAMVEVDLPHAALYVAPCIAGHVGADTAAAILAEGPHRGDEMQLLVDVGTNAEIVLGDRIRQYAASSPTGPAFEGAQISCGQRATAGAIERVRIDPDTLEPRVRVIGSEQWSDDPGFAESVTRTGVTGVCGSGIIEVVAEMYLAQIIDADGTIRGEAATRSPRVVADGRTWSYVLYEDGDTRLVITQHDVRAIQLAKAALRAGIDLLVEHAGAPDVHDIRLAGAFGAHIDPVHALVLGLVPDCPVAGVRAVGNAAGAGAVRALLSRSARAEMELAVRDVTKIETATEPRFQELFVAAMAFPHATAPSPHLATVVRLPEPLPPPERSRRRERKPRT